jgi:hypothetical protein
MIEFVERFLDKRKSKRKEREILKSCGCVCYCKCGSTLNDQECMSIDDGAYYKYTCRCGVESIFDFNYPVPVMIARIE